MNNEILKVPFQHGWVRELVFRQPKSCPNNKITKCGDVYYYAPIDRRKIRSLIELNSYLKTVNTTLTSEHFSFSQIPLGIKDTEKEIIRNSSQRKRKKVPETTGRKLRSRDVGNRTLSPHPTPAPTPSMDMTKPSSHQLCSKPGNTPRFSNNNALDLMGSPELGAATPEEILQVLNTMKPSLKLDTSPTRHNEVAENNEFNEIQTITEEMSPDMCQKKQGLSSINQLLMSRPVSPLIESQVHHRTLIPSPTSAPLSVLVKSNLNLPQTSPMPGTTPRSSNLDFKGTPELFGRTELDEVAQDIAINELQYNHNTTKTEEDGRLVQDSGVSPQNEEVPENDNVVVVILLNKKSAMAADIKNSLFKMPNKEHQDENGDSYTCRMGMGDDSGDYGIISRSTNCKLIDVESMLEEMEEEKYRKPKKKYRKQDVSKRFTLADLNKVFKSIQGSSSHVGASAETVQKQPSATSAEDNGSPSSSSLDMVALKQDILCEMRKEFQKMKKDIMEDVKKENSKK